MLFTVTPDSGVNVVLPDPASITKYWYPTGIETDEFAGIVKFIEEEVLSRIVFPASNKSSIKLEFLDINVV